MTAGFPVCKFSLDKTVKLFALLCVSKGTPKLKLTMFLNVWDFLDKEKSLPITIFCRLS